MANKMNFSNNKLRSSMPQLDSALHGWESDFVINRREQKNDDGDINWIDCFISFSGTVQPLSVEQLALKPEGDRAFQWWQIHATSSDQDLNVGDQIVYDDKPYKVQAKNNYKLNGYIEYHIVEDYTNAKRD